MHFAELRLNYVNWFCFFEWILWNTYWSIQSLGPPPDLCPWVTPHLWSPAKTSTNLKCKLTRIFYTWILSFHFWSAWFDYSPHQSNHSHFQLNRSRHHYLAVTLFYYCSLFSVWSKSQSSFRKFSKADRPTIVSDGLNSFVAAKIKNGMNKNGHFLYINWSWNNH